MFIRISHSNKYIDNIIRESVDSYKVLDFKKIASRVLFPSPWNFNTTADIPGEKFNFMPNILKTRYMFFSALAGKLSQPIPASPVKLYTYRNIYTRIPAPRATTRDLKFLRAPCHMQWLRPTLTRPKNAPSLQHLSSSRCSLEPRAPQICDSKHNTKCNIM